MGVETLVATVLVVVGIVGTVLPVLPGLILVLGGIAVWAVPRADAVGWAVLAAAATIVVLGTVAKYVLPGARLRESGVPSGTIALGAVLGIVGFFVVPVVGVVAGFVLGIWLAEVSRLGRERAWPSTRGALGAVGWSILIELAAGLLAAAVWIVGLVVG